MTVYLDFEFSRITEEKLNLVCCVTHTEKETLKWWLHNDPSVQKDLKDYLKKFKQVVGYSCVAEARSYLTLGLNPLSFNWIDLFLEYRCLSNHNDSLNYGWQLKDGKKIMTSKPKPKWERSEDDAKTGFKPTHSLAEATFKLLQVVRDTVEKDRMRDLIISDPAEFTGQQREDILNYCLDDVVELPKIEAEIKKHFNAKLGRLKEQEYQKEAEWRGRYAAHTAIMESKGYPIDLEKTRNFSNKVGSILYDCQREINDLFPEIKPFRWNRVENRFSWNQTVTKDWIKSLKPEIVDNWMLTDGGKKGKPDLSLSLDAFQQFFDFKHDYPKDNFGAQILRFLKLKQSLFGFQQNKDSDKKSFWDSVGSDGRVRPYMNIYGAQSSRSQPASTGFMFLKPAWMRSLVVPPPGYAMAGIDYGSEEFFIGALLSRDPNMIKAYLSDDVYLEFYKLAGLIPMDATKQSHKKLRDQAKRTVLGISYNMTKFGLAIALSSDSGEEWTEDEAQEEINRFNSTFPMYYAYRKNITESYEDEEPPLIKLADGWYMWGNNPNMRSVGNVPIQGMGAVIMRKAVDLAVSKGLYVPFTLHDALYIEYKVGDEYKIKILNECMKEAFAFYFPDQRETALKIKLDPFAWSPDYEKDSEIIVEDLKIPSSNIYIDERAGDDYQRFSKYFDKSLADLL